MLLWIIIGGEIDGIVGALSKEDMLLIGGKRSTLKYSEGRRESGAMTCVGAEGNIQLGRTLLSGSSISSSVSNEGSYTVATPPLFELMGMIPILMQYDF